MTTHLHRLALLLALAAAAAACGKEQRPPPNVISSEKFIAANVALRTVPDTAPDPGAVRLARMGQQEVTPEQLQGFVDAHERDLAYMAALWDTIARQVEMQNAAMERERNEARGRRPEEAARVDTGGPPLPGGPGGPAEVTEELRRRSRRQPSAGMEVPVPPRPEPHRDQLRYRERAPRPRQP